MKNKHSRLSSEVSNVSTSRKAVLYLQHLENEVEAIAGQSYLTFRVALVIAWAMVYALLSIAEAIREKGNGKA